MLRYGPSSDTDVFKKKIALACMEKYKTRLITDEKYYEPPQIDLTKYNLANDIHDIEKGGWRKHTSIRARRLMACLQILQACTHTYYQR
jgi:hypothetical protein